MPEKHEHEHDMSISISSSVDFRDFVEEEGVALRKNVASKFNHDFQNEKSWLICVRKGEGEGEEEGQ